MNGGGYLLLELGDVKRMIRVDAETFFAWARERYAPFEIEMAHIERMAAGYCLHPGCAEPGELHAQPTSYKDELSNWTCLCEPHRAENDAFWNEQIDEANRSRLF